MDENKNSDCCSVLLDSDGVNVIENVSCDNSHKRIKFNVGGKLFECLAKTLKRYPDSRLAHLDKSTDDNLHGPEEYFFDRNPIIFEAVLEACRTGELHVPRETCYSTLKRELEFWKIPPGYLSPCCWKSFYRADNDTRKISALAEFYQQNTNMCLLMKENSSNKAKLWLFLDEPKSSTYAMIWAVFMTVIVIVSTFCLTCVTVGSFRVDNRSDEQKQTVDYFHQLSGHYNSTDRDIVDSYKRVHPIIYITMITCFIFISVEICLRLVSCPSSRKYLKCTSHICEIISACAFWLNIYTDVFLENFKSYAGYMFFIVIRCLVVLQIARLVRIGRHFMAFNIMSLSINSSLPEIGVLFSLFLILVTVFGWLMYIAEAYNDRFESGFSAMYWALITLTTVGYGDLYPESAFGLMIACACAICGLVTLALPIGVIAASFNSYYSHHKYVSKHITDHKPYELERNKSLIECA